MDVMAEKTLKNPYLDKIEKLYPDVHKTNRSLFCVPPNLTQVMERRIAMVSRYAYAIPSEGAIRTIARLGPIIEIGAATGYWAWLLHQAGADVVAYDAIPADDQWYPVHQGLDDRAGDYPSHTLLLCWPSLGEPMAYDALTRYLDAGGHTLAYVGEGRGGCTADDSFHALAHDEASKVDMIEIPRWWGINDALYIYHFEGNR